MVEQSPYCDPLTLLPLVTEFNADEILTSVSLPLVWWDETGLLGIFPLDIWH